MEVQPYLGNTAFYDLDIIADYLSGKKNMNLNTVADAMSNIRRTYNLYGNELKLVSHLISDIIDGMPYWGVCGIINEPDESVCREIVESLVKKDIVYVQDTPSGLKNIALTPRAVCAFNRYRSIGMRPNIDFVEELRSSELSLIKSDRWIENFKGELISDMLSDFTEGWFSLKVNEMGNRLLKTFCLVLKQFILHFTEPLSIGPKALKTGANINDSCDDEPDIDKGDLEVLVQKGLVISVEGGYRISPKVAETLFHGHDEIVNYHNIAETTTVIKSEDIKKQELFFSPESQEEIDHLHFMLSKDGFERARSVLLKKKRNPAIQSLLWGGPGTGKTETVKQIAAETGRDILLFEVAKVTTNEWGGTEKLYRKLFLSYRYIVAVKSLTPILLINEADQVLSRRLSELERAIDKAENTVSNILLQEFEDMHGILLATTNNIKILDEAFDRRFLFKTELQKPDARARKSIWKSMIPELSDAEAELLAEKYEMSGAQINNVATKRDLAEVYFLGDRGLPYIEKLCGNVLSTEKPNIASRRIGY